MKKQENWACVLKYTVNTPVTSSNPSYSFVVVFLRGIFCRWREMKWGIRSFLLGHCRLEKSSLARFPKHRPYYCIVRGLCSRWYYTPPTVLNKVGYMMRGNIFKTEYLLTYICTQVISAGVVSMETKRRTTLSYLKQYQKVVESGCLNRYSDGLRVRFPVGARLFQTQLPIQWVPLAASGG
jgi:hypothetical protein